MNYVIFNKDGSVAKKDLTEIINQNSDRVNKMFVHIKDTTPEDYGVSAVFRLPNGTSSQRAADTVLYELTIDNVVYRGYVVELTAIETTYAGNLVMSIVCYNAETKGTLWSYPVYLTVNETVVDSEAPITRSEYLTLLQQIAKKLPKSGGSANPMTGNLHMGGHDVREVSTVSLQNLVAYLNDHIKVKNNLKMIDSTILNSRFIPSFSIGTPSPGLTIEEMFDRVEEAFGDLYENESTGYREILFYNTSMNEIILLENGGSIGDDNYNFALLSLDSGKMFKGKLTKTNRHTNMYLATYQIAYNKKDIDNIVSTINNALDTKLNKSGGTMSGDLDMGGHEIKKATNVLPIISFPISTTVGNVINILREKLTGYSYVFYHPESSSIIRVNNAHDVYWFITTYSVGTVRDAGLGYEAVLTESQQFNDVFYGTQIAYSKDNIDYLLSRKLSTSGGTITGGLNMTGHNIEGVQEIKANSIKVGNKEVATREYVDSQSGHYLTANEGDDTFASYAALIAGPWYWGATLHTPDNNDFAIVQSDETHSNKTTRYSYQNGEWSFQYVINDLTLTQEQLSALNSGVTSEVLENLSRLVNTVVCNSTKEVSGIVVPDLSQDQITDIHNHLVDRELVIIECGEDYYVVKSTSENDEGDVFVFIDYEDTHSIAYELNSTSEEVEIVVKSKDLSQYRTAHDQDIIDEELREAIDSKSGAKIIEVGSGQATYFNKLFPQLTKAKATEIYDTYTGGTPVIMRWTVMGSIPVEATVIGSDYVAGKKSFNVVIHDTYSVEYSYTDSTGTIADTEVKELGGDHFSDLVDTYSGAYNGEDLAFKFASEISQFANIGAWLQNRIDTGNFKGLRIHDYFLLTLTNNEVFEMEIAGINTYLDSSDLNETKLHIDFVSKDLWTVTTKWNNQNYNNGITFTFDGDGANKTFNITSELNSRGATNYPHIIDTVNYTAGGAAKTLRNNSGYTYDNTTGIITITGSNPAPDNNTKVYIGIANPVLCSNVYAQVNALKTCVPNGTTVNPALMDVDYTSTGLYALLPEWIKPYIKAKPMQVATRFTTTAIRTNADNQYAYAYPKLWLLEEMEVYGTPMFATGTYDKWFAKQYPAFIGNSRIKRSGRKGSRASWWLASASSGNATYACHVYNNGSAANISASYAWRVPLCFRFKKA